MVRITIEVCLRHRDSIGEHVQLYQERRQEYYKKLSYICIPVGKHIIFKQNKEALTFFPAVFFKFFKYIY